MYYRSRGDAVNIAPRIYAFAILCKDQRIGADEFCLPRLTGNETGIIYVFNIFYLKLRDLKSNYTLFFLRTRFLHVQRNTNILERVKTCFRLLYTNLTNNLAFEDYTSQISI